MLIFDELRKNDPQLRLVAVMVAAGLFVLFAGLWWVQVVSSREYQSHLETQAYRTVRVPAARGKILDCEGRVLAENTASYNLELDLSDLSQQFKDEYKRLRPYKIVTNSPPFWKLWLGASSVEKKYVRLSREDVDNLSWRARYDVVKGIASEIARKIGEPLPLDPNDFKRHYATELAMSYPLLSDLDTVQVARFEEHYTGELPASLQMESQRVYPYGMTAAHLLGYVKEDDESINGEDSYFDYRLPDYKGVVGIEGGFDTQLHGHAGAESVLVNNLGYRQTENVWDPPVAGHNVVLTLDLDLQRAAEKSLAAHQGTNARAAIVVMNVQSGDVLTMVSFPQFDPNEFAKGISQEQYDQIQQLTAEKNRATQENYAPGSIFKPVVALAALENGLNPNQIYNVQPDPQEPWHGCIYVGRRKIRDTVPPGKYDLQRAIEQSSNAYFVYNGMNVARIENIVRLAEKFHFGEREDLPTRQETSGIFPSLKEVESADWHDGDSANICFGQGKMAVTPMQMAVAYCAIANGGTVLWPRLVARIEPQDSTSGEQPVVYPAHVVRDHIGVSQRSLTILREAMLTETEDAAGTGRAAVVGPEMRICGKTGTAQVQNEHGQLIGYNFWFASFAPYENPKYAVVVMVQSTGHGSGGSVCAPIAHDIYEEILKKEQAKANVAAN